MKLTRFFSLKENIYLVLAVSCGLVLAVITPPFAGVPDEGAHYWKSWSVALGQFSCSDGNQIPKSAYELPSVNFPPAVKIPGVGTRYVFHDTVERLFDKDTGALTKGGTAVCGTFPAGFLPQAIGLRVGRWLHLSALGDFYLARICNMLVSVFLVYLAIRIIPFGKIVLLFIGLLPMTMQQFSSFSYDALHISSCLLFIAYVVKLSTESKEQLRPGEMALLLALGLVSVNVKLGYVGLAFLVFMLPESKFPTPKRYWLFSTGYVGANVLVFFAAYQAFSGVGFTRAVFSAKMGFVGLLVLAALFLASKIETLKRHWRPATVIAVVGALIVYAAYLLHSGADVGGGGSPGIDSSRQLSYVIRTPIKFLFLVFEAVYYRFNFYLESFLYKPGWLTVSLHPGWYVFLLTGMAFLLRNETEAVSLTRKQRFVALSVFFVNFLMVFLAQYLSWSNVGGNVIEGVQGRYWLCTAPLPIFFFYKSDFTFRHAYIGKHLRALLFIFYLALFGGVVLSIYNIYYDKEPSKPIVTKIREKLSGRR